MEDERIKAIKFANQIGLKLKVTFVHFGTTPQRNDGIKYYIYKCRLSRNKKSFTFELDSKETSKTFEPTFDVYDALLSLQRHDPISLADFCDEYGNDFADSYKGCLKEWEAINRLVPEDDLIKRIEEMR
jgi:ABC-type taurine transport system substrate-binding protein